MDTAPLKKTVKELAAIVLSIFGRLCRASDCIVVLMYHNVGTEVNDKNTISAQAFEKQITELEKQRFRCVQLVDVVDWIRHGHAPSGRHYAISFDDGRRGISDVALEVLKRHNATATVFVVSAFVGGGRRWFSYRKVPPSWISEDECRLQHGFCIEYMTDAMLRSWKSDGNSIGAHGTNHLHLTTLPRGLLESELDCSREATQRLTGEERAGFAYPYGEYNAVVVDAVGQRFDFAVTTEQRCVAVPGEMLMTIPRIDPGRSRYELLARLITSGAIGR